MNLVAKWELEKGTIKLITFLPYGASLGLGTRLYCFGEQGLESKPLVIFDE